MSVLWSRLKILKSMRRRCERSLFLAAGGENVRVTQNTKSAWKVARESRSSSECIVTAMYLTTKSTSSSVRAQSKNVNLRCHRSWSVFTTRTLEANFILHENCCGLRHARITFKAHTDVRTVHKARSMGQGGVCKGSLVSIIHCCWSILRHCVSFFLSLVRFS